MHCCPLYLIVRSDSKTMSSATKAVAASTAMLLLVTAQTVASERGIGGLTDSRTAAKHLIVVDASGLVIPFGLERELRGYWECREGSRGSDAGLCPRRVLAGGLVRSH